MTIKHLVLPGGGPIMFKLFGACKFLQENNVFNMNDIKSIFATSCGSIVAVLLCLKYDWDTIYDYIIKRPWHEAYKIDIKTIMDAYTKRGIFDKNIVEIFFKSLFNAKDISMDITLKEFYEYCKIDIHLFSFEINQFQLEDISHITHPNLSLLTAIQMTCAIPIIIAPVCINNKCYIDGGVVSNYPLNYCIEKNINLNDILSFKNIWDSSKKNEINTDSTLIEFIMSFLYKLIFQLSTEKNQNQIDNEVYINKSEYMSLLLIQKVLYSVEIRKELFEDGVKSGSEFLLKRENLQNCI